jgi:hypothetical protein
MVRLMRFHDWERRLLDWAEASVGQPFVWGVTDCHALALAALDVMYGGSVRPIPTSPVWSNPTVALRLYREWNPAGFLPLLGATVRPLGYVQRGDLVLEPIPEQGHFHPVLVALGAGRFLTSAPEEPVRIAPLVEVNPAATAWRFA